MIHSILRIALSIPLLGLSATTALAASMSASLTAPTIDGYDIANYGTVTGTDKWWTESNSSGYPKGQTFTTSGGAVRLGAITYQVTATQKAEPAKTYAIRVGTISGTTFTEIYSETVTQSFTWNGGEYMTWTFDTPPLLIGNTTYGIDVGMTNSTSGSPTGIPYLNRTANEYLDGTRYMSGSAGGGIGDTTMNNISGDMVFHIDLSPPLGGGFNFIEGSPPDEKVDALVPTALVGTFSQNLVMGSGSVTIRNLTDSIDTVIPIGDPRISIADHLLTITPTTPLLWSKNYAIQIDPSALLDSSSNAFAGISDDTTWNFLMATGDPFLDAITELKEHINGVMTLSAPQIDAHKQAIDVYIGRFDESATTIAAIFDLVETYDAVVGPLWVARGQFSRNSQVNDLDWTMYHVMQYIMDEVYNAPAIVNHEALLDGFKFESSADFPGALAPPVNPANTHSVSINSSFPDTFGRNTQMWTVPARKPTGTYLAPGTVATVTVPAALVGQGYKVRVGAHSWDLSHRKWVRRLDRATILYPIDATTTKIVSPYGGGIYIEVPMGASAGVVSIDVTGGVRSPYFSAKTFHATTPAEWLVERTHPAPWADFQSDKFMMQVPTNWIYALPDPTALMANWDLAMDAMNDLMGFPHLRGKETEYPQVDVLMRSSVHAPGYPSVNNVDNPNNDRGGNHDSYLVQGPQTGWSTEFHEQGHSYFFPKFGGESESTVNLLHVAVWHRKFGYDLDYSFAGSFGFEGNLHRTLDNTAVTWMCVFNFSPREVPMATAEKAYQLKGHAKFVDVVRLFGWEGLDAFWLSFNQDEEDGVSYSTFTDDMLLRLCQGVGEDIRPLFHFWGIHPSDPAALASTVAAEGLTPSFEIYDRLVHYKSLVPVDNAAFQSFALNWWNKQPSINGNWTEREHARQWDTTELFEVGDQQRPNGEIYVEASAMDIEARVQELIDLYYPGGRPLTDYESWAAQYPGSDLTDSNADLDEDGMTNDEERAWGLDPTSAASRNPISVPLDVTGNFIYTRRYDFLSGLSYTVWTSTTLAPGSWIEDTGAVQLAGDPNVNEVETVTVTLSSGLMTAPERFVRVQAE